MEKSVKTIAWFEEITRNDIGIAGGKGANLGEMVHAQIPVPPGFIVTATAYFEFLKETQLEKDIRTPTQKAGCQRQQNTAGSISQDKG